LLIYSYQFLQEKNIGLSHVLGAKTQKHDSVIDEMHNGKQWLLVIFNNEKTALIRAATHLPKRFLRKRTKTEDIRLGFRAGTFFLYLPPP